MTGATFLEHSSVSSPLTYLKEEGFIKVKVTAQPIENKANKALVEYFSKTFKVPKTKIEIVAL